MFSARNQLNTLLALMAGLIIAAIPVTVTFAQGYNYTYGSYQQQTMQPAYYQNSLSEPVSAVLPEPLPESVSKHVPEHVSVHLPEPVPEQLPVVLPEPVSEPLPESVPEPLHVAELFL
jgi:hypothetical protein